MKFVFILPLLILSIWSKAGDSIPPHHLELGIRSMKFVGFYWENGFAVEYSSSKILDHKVQFGASVLSSHLGSAFLSNGVPSTQFEFSVIKHFRHDHFFQPLLRLNTGIAHANYRSTEFDALPKNGFLLSAEFGLSYRIPLREENMSLKAGLGYNLFTGNGKKGLSTVFPVYGQFSLLYRLL
jgi:hypothetical protein